MASTDETEESRISPEETLKAAVTKLQASISEQNLEIGTLEGTFSSIPTFINLNMGLNSSDSSKNNSDGSTSTDSYPSTTKLAVISEEDVPKWFLCPISSEVMRNPVVVETGETYDRDYIKKWIDDGNLTCPKTQKVLSENHLIPNLLLQRLISHWTIHKNFDLPSPTQISKPTEATRLEVHKLFNKITSSDTEISYRRNAALELRKLTTNSKSCRKNLVEIPNSITILLSFSSDDTNDSDPELKEQLTLIVSALCNDRENRYLFSQSDQRILVETLRSGQTMLTRASAAAAIYFLLTVEDNRRIILDFGALIPIQNLFATGDSDTKEVTCSILFTLCTSFPEAVETLVESGGRETIRPLLSAVRDSKMRKKALAILGLISKHQKSAAEIMGICGVGWVLEIVCNTGEDTDCLKSAIAVLHNLVMPSDDIRVWKEVEDRSGHLFVMSESEFGIVSVMAEEILSRLRWGRKGKGIVIG